MVCVCLVVFVVAVVVFLCCCFIVLGGMYTCIYLFIILPVCVSFCLSSYGLVYICVCKRLSA